MRWIFTMIGFVVFLCIGVFLWVLYDINVHSITVYEPDYSYDLDMLTDLKTDRDITIDYESIYRMDRSAFQLVSESALSNEDALTLYARITYAEREFVALTYKVSGGLHGSVVPLVHTILCEALPEDCWLLKRSLSDYPAFDDPYTQALTEQVYKQVAGGNFLNVPVATVWSDARDVVFSTFTPTDVSAIFTATEEEYVRILEEQTTVQKRAALLWEGSPGTRQPAGIMLELMNDYFTRETTPPLATFVDERARFVAIMQHVLEDVPTSIAKYTYPDPRSYVMVSPTSTVASTTATTTDESVNHMSNATTTSTYINTSDTQAFPVMFVAITTVMRMLDATLTDTVVKDDLEKEYMEAQNAYRYSGSYYPFAISDAEDLGRRIYEVFNE